MTNLTVKRVGSGHTTLFSRHFSSLSLSVRGDETRLTWIAMVVVPLAVVPVEQTEVPHRAVDGGELVDEPDLGLSARWRDAVGPARHDLIYVYGPKLKS
jgi:hypothetical protein